MNNDNESAETTSSGKEFQTVTLQLESAIEEIIMIVQ